MQGYLLLSIERHLVPFQLCTVGQKQVIKILRFKGKGATQRHRYWEMYGGGVWVHLFELAFISGNF